MANRLAGETSPYLLQHAHNPVDWYPWGGEALNKAQTEDKPILLSIGYSACHWCHVMERESFEDQHTADVMNQHFVSIKVDREERPDLDGIYMQAVQAMTGQGGWPMTVFLTPDGTPFYGGTYFPPEDRHSMPAFTRVLESIADAWRTKRHEVEHSGQQLREHLQQATRPAPSRRTLDPSLLDAAAQGILSQYEPTHAGFGNAPKFPQPMAIEFLLRHWRRTGDERAQSAAVHTLDQMARGGMYDQLGGGFHRYSVDGEWLVPHFEKMLYDNAQLARAYLMGYQATRNAFYRTVVEQILNYVLRDMTDPSGGFYSTEDADSEGVEGKFYSWTPAELRALLGDDDARLFAAYYDVTERGNFEHGTSILHVTDTPLAVAQRLGVPEARLLEALERGRTILFEARERRIRPARDDKVLSSWNGMLLRALAEAGRVLNDPTYLRAALNNAEFLLGTMRTHTGAVLRTWKPGHAAHLNGYLEDYANIADGLVALYEATFDQRWLVAATELADAILAQFSDSENGGFFDTSTEHETLITRPKDVFDNATPSGNAVAADVLLRLAVLTANQDYQRAAQGVFELLREPMVRYPLGFARSLSALDFLLGRPKEIAIFGSLESADTQALLDAVFEPFLPNKVVAGANDGAAPADIPLLEGRTARNGRATAYVCEQYVCQAPTSDPEELRAQLG
ncbi:MAG TPA: thioredoxin domain-containing protein [Chloroflexota bacterium]